MELAIEDRRYPIKVEYRTGTWKMGSYWYVSCTTPSVSSRAPRLELALDMLTALINGEPAC